MADERDLDLLESALEQALNSPDRSPKPGSQHSSDANGRRDSDSVSGRSSSPPSTVVKNGRKPRIDGDNDSSPARSRSPPRPKPPTAPAACSAGTQRPQRATPPVWLRPVPPPKPQRGMEWWVHPLHTALEGERAQLAPKPARAMSMDAMCSGTCCELLIYRVLNCTVEARCIADKKKVARDFAYQMFREHFDSHGTYMFDSYKAATDGGKCFLRKAMVEPPEDPGSLDLAIQGLPCQPFSSMRRGASAPPPEGHHAFNTIFADFFAYLSKHRPKGFIVENIVDFCRRKAYAHDDATYLDVFASECRGQGYVVKAFQLSAEVWSETPRSRLYIVGFSKLLGGETAATWFEEKVNAAVKHRKLLKPTPLTEVLGMPMQDDMMRREVASLPEWKVDKQGGAFATWRADSARVRTSLGVSPYYAEWTSRAKLTNVPKVERLYDLLNCAWAARLREGRAAGFDTDENALRVGFYVNLSQGVARRPWSSSPPTLCTTSMIYSFEMDCAVSGLQMMQMQGWPVALNTGLFTDEQYRQLAGEGFSLPCAGIICYLYYLNPQAPWWTGATLTT